MNAVVYSEPSARFSEISRSHLGVMGDSDTRIRFWNFEGFAASCASLSAHIAQRSLVRGAVSTFGPFPFRRRSPETCVWYSCLLAHGLTFFKNRITWPWRTHLIFKIKPVSDQFLTGPPPTIIYRLIWWLFAQVIRLLFLVIPSIQSRPIFRSIMWWQNQPKVSLFSLAVVSIASVITITLFLMQVTVTEAG